MNKELSILDIISPIWIKKIEIVFVLISVSLFVYCSVYLSKKILNTEPDLQHHQDLQFNNKLDQKYISNFINEMVIVDAYKENNLILSNGNASDNISLVNSSSRYDVMRELILDETGELIINLNNLASSDKIKQNLWDEYLNLDSKYHQLIFYDNNLTSLESKKVISTIINNFNDYHSTKNTMSLDTISMIGFDVENADLSYLNNRLQEVIDHIREYTSELNNLAIDISELSFNANILMFHIYNIDPSLFGQNMKKLEHQIIQNKLLKENLLKLHDKFYLGYNSSEFKNSESQLSVDSITQLIDLGGNISELENKEKLTDAIYRIDLNINELENKIFDLNSVQSIFLLNYKQLSTDEINSEVKGVVDLINENIDAIRQSVNEQAVYTRGNIFVKYDYKANYNVGVFSFLIISIFMLFYMPTIYIRHYYR
tara:strand:+ start:393 stop:1679 length:1287 start_codon:yes stop_codon:yes gene_type:complete